MKEEIFISTLSILVLFNTFVCLVNPNVSSVLTMDLKAIVITGLTIAISSSITIFGSGLAPDVSKMLFTSIVLLNVMFQVNIYGFTIGIGLINTLINVFSPTDAWGLGYLLALTISFITFCSAIMIVAENA